MSNTEKKQNERRLSNFLREKRISAGLSQGQVARKLGYSTAQFISNWERGVSEPPLKAIKILAKMYSVSIDEIYEVVLATTIQKVEEDLKSKFKRIK